MHPAGLRYLLACANRTAHYAAQKYMPVRTPPAPGKPSGPKIRLRRSPQSVGSLMNSSLPIPSMVKWPVHQGGLFSCKTAGGAKTGSTLENTRIPLRHEDSKPSIPAHSGDSEFFAPIAPIYFGSMRLRDAEAQ